MTAKQKKKLVEETAELLAKIDHKPYEQGAQIMITALLMKYEVRERNKKG